MIGAILSTDMAKHFPTQAEFKGKLQKEDYDYVKDKQFICEQLFHTADISNPVKPWDICQKWTEHLFVEFFDQGD